MAGKPNPPKQYCVEPTGRPSKFTPERCAAIVDAISRRAPYEFAAEGNGISQDTLYEWLKIGKSHRDQCIESEYSKFSENIKRAELHRIIEHSDKIASNVDKWTGDAWLLERRWHRHYSTNAPVIELNQRLARLEGETNEKRDEEKGCDEAGSKEDDLGIGKTRC